jgi:hypothetical protein
MAEQIFFKTSPLSFLNHSMHAHVGSGVAETDPSIQGHALMRELPHMLALSRPLHRPRLTQTHLD